MGNIIGHIVYDGVDSRDYGVIVSSVGTHDAPKRVVENIEIPGRNGTLTVDGGRFENITVSYIAMIMKDFPDKFDAFKAFLLSCRGYKRLEDTFAPDYFRLAKIHDNISPSVVTWDAAGKFEIPFDCDPRRFLKSGEEMIEFPENATSGEINNPTLFDAKPLLRVYGSGTVSLGSKTITIINNLGYVYIDLETYNAYNIINMNDLVSIPDDTVLKPGLNTIGMSGVVELAITPRWWTI